MPYDHEEPKTAARRGSQPDLEEPSDTSRVATQRARRKGSLSDMVAGTLGRRIVSSQYKPGNALPTEPKIQEEFGVSRTAVREAMRLLSAKGLTLSRPKTGTRVRPMAEWNMLDPDVLRWHVEQKPSEAFIHALFEMREIIEPAAAGHAAERATEEQLLALGAAMEGLQSERRASPEQIKADIAFHMTLLEASQNPILRSVGALIKSALEISFSLSWGSALTDDAVFQHRAIFDAVRLKQPDEAFMAMRRLLRNSKGDVIDALWMLRTDARPRT